MQQARAIVDPFGDDRADTRAQINTTQILAQNTHDESVRDSVAEMVAAYYETDDRDDNNLELNAAALAALPKVTR